MPTTPIKSTKVHTTDEENFQALCRAYQAYLANLLSQGKISSHEKTDYEENATSKSVLRFKSQSDVDTFFTEQAKMKLQFLAVPEDADGNPTGEYLFANGDGTLYKGKFSPETINALKSAIEELETSPEDLVAAIDKSLRKGDESGLLAALEGLKDEQSSAFHP
jgi:hypothetical protein